MIIWAFVIDCRHAFTLQLSRWMNTTTKRRKRKNEKKKTEHLGHVCTAYAVEWKKQSETENEEQEEQKKYSFLCW